MTKPISKFWKTPDERKRYSITYTDWLDTGETISSVTFGVTPPGSLVVDASVVNPGGQAVTFFVSSGSEGAAYEVVATIETSSGQIKQSKIEFAVRAA